jgi:hypothetical protein
MGQLDAIFTQGVFGIALAVFALATAVADAWIAARVWARIVVIVLALVLGAGEVYSIVRDHQRADAVEAYHQRQITKLQTTVSSQDGDISNLDGQIAALRKQIVTLATHQDVTAGVASIQGTVNRAISRSAAPIVPAILGHYSWVPSRLASDNPAYPFGLQVIVQTSVSNAHVSLLIECSGPIGVVHPEFAGIVQANPYYGVPNTAHPNIAMVQYIVTPPFAPDNPITIDLFAKSDIRVVRITSSAP